MFPLRLDEVDRYLLRRLALERGQSANALVAMLVQAEIDRALPGAREAYQRRGEVAEQVLRRRGVDPDSESETNWGGKLRAWLTCGSVLAGWAEGGAPVLISIVDLGLARQY